MISAFKGLTEQEQHQLIDAVAQITLLVGGADGNMDQEEKEWAEKITKIRTWDHPNNEITGEFYTVVGKDYRNRLEALIKDMPEDTDKRSQMLSDKLAKLNTILPKIDPEFGAAYYHSLTSFAEHVAKAAGGFMGFFSISSEESKWIDLPMIENIFPEEEEEA